MADLMTLAAKLTLDDAGFQSGIKSAESAGEKLSGKISAMTVAAGNLISDLVKQGANAVKSFISDAVDSYADYEQLVGGVDTLFKESSTKVQQYAKNAYQSAGLSANEYMETVTSFSASLIQGLKGDTEEAAELANMAITDMSDNANKMGTDISSIQTAYQGFAKQNYTMLDNLKLGYGGTADEMVRLVNDSGILDTEIKNLDGITFDQLVEAIHAIQTEMGITGTTAKEAAETISGSKASLSAAWKNLLSAVGGEGDQQTLDDSMEKFKESFTAYMENFLPTLVTTIVNSGSLVSGIAEAVASLPTDLLSNIMNAGVEAGTDMVSGLDTLVTWLIDSLVVMFNNASYDNSNITEFGEAIGKFLGNTVSNLVSNVPALLNGMINVGISLAGGILQGIFEGLFGTGEDDKLKEITDGLEDTIIGAEVSSNRAQAILAYMQDLKNEYGEAATETGEWQAAEEELEKVLGGSKQVFEEYGSDVQGAIDKLKGMAEELRKLAIQQAMQGALEEEYKLLGEYETERYRTLANIKMNQDTIDQNNADIATSLQAYAKQYVDLYKDNPLVSEASINEATMLSQGKVLENGEYVDIANASTSLLRDLINSYSGDLEDLGMDAIWNESLEDTIFDPATLNQMITDNASYEAQIKSATEAVKESEEKIANVQTAISEMETAVALATADLGSFAESTATASNALSKIRSLTVTVSGDEATVSSEHAIGMDYVPFTGYKASLHKGEAIISAEENHERLYGNNTIDIEASLEQAIENAMSKMSVSMSGDKVGDVTTKRVSSNITNYDRTHMVALGGW